MNIVASDLLMLGNLRARAEIATFVCLFADVQTDQIASSMTRTSGAVDVDLVSARFNHPTLRVREVAKFMDSALYFSAVEV